MLAKPSICILLGLVVLKIILEVGSLTNVPDPFSWGINKRPEFGLRTGRKDFETGFSDLNWIGGDISSDKSYKSEHFGHFRFSIPVANWHFLIKV